MNVEKTANGTVLSCKQLTRHYKRGTETVRALSNVDLEIGPGKLVALVGPSGSGKTTLMNLVGCLDRPSSGEIWLRGKRVDNLPGKKLVQIRRETVGFIFQNFYLLPELSARENVVLPMLFARSGDRAKTAKELLAKVGLIARLDHLPSEMSGGEMQRVAIARALANGPAIILADEPTGKLDTKNGQAIAVIFKELARTGITILMATHDTSLADQADEVIALRDGSRLA